MIIENIFKNFFSLAIIISIISCGGNSHETLPEGFQVINAAPDFSSIDVAIGVDPVLAQVDYGKSSGYLEVQEGEEIPLRIRTEDDVLPSITESLTIEKGKNYSYLVVEEEEAIKGVLLDDDNTDPDPSLFKIRFINAGLSSSGIDIYITKPDQDIGDKTPLVSNLEFEKASDYQSIDQGDYRIIITRTDKDTILYDSDDVSFGEGRIITLVFLEKQGGGRPFRGTFLQDK